MERIGNPKDLSINTNGANGDRSIITKMQCS